MYSWLYLILLLISPEVFAGIFDPPPSDESMHMLGMIFGSNIGNVYLGGLPNPVMSAIMEKFNFIVVVVGSVVISYVAVISVINTAQEGTAMGKKWSAIWVPMRSIAGMSLMIPSPASGYSMIQVTIIWIIVQGIGAADQIWNITLEGLKTGASATIGSSGAMQSNMLSIQNDATTITNNLLSIAICMEALSEFGKSGTSHINNSDWLHNKSLYIKHYTGDATLTPDPPTTSATIAGTSYFGVNDDTDSNSIHTSTCGSVYIEGRASIDDYGAAYFTGKSPQETAKILTDAAQLIYDTKELAISSMLTVLQPLAQAIVKGTVKQPMNNTDNTPIDPQGYSISSNDAYVKLLNGLVVPVEAADLQQPLKDAINIGEQKGWIVAGSYYFVLNKSLTPKIFSSIYGSPTFNGVIACDAKCVSDLYASPQKFALEDNTTLKSLELTPAEIDALNSYLATGSIYLRNDIAVQAGLNFSSALAGGGNDIVKALAAPLNSLVQQLIGAMNGSAGSATGDALLSHSIFGRDMMLAMEATWFIIIGLVLSIGLISLLAPFTAGPAAMFLGMLMTILTIILPITALVWTIGAGLAIYAPLIPFMIFTTAALGWMLAVIEAVIAAPLIALSLVTPAGDELGKVETALMILANIFLRPMLMIFGFLLAGRLYNGVVSLINLGMLQVFNTIDVQTIFSSILVLFAYAAFVIGMTNTCFSLVYAIPDKIMRWIGGHAEQTDMSAVQSTKSAFNATANEVGKSSSDVAGLSAKGAQGAAKGSAAKNANSGGKSGGGGKGGAGGKGGG